MTQLLLQAVLPSLVVLLGALAFLRFAERRIRHLSSRRRLLQGTDSTTKIILRWVVGVAALLVIATLFDLDMGSVWNGLSALLAIVAIGLFAGWSLISSCLATIIILIWCPYKVGNHIELLPDGIKGQVVDMSMMFSSLVDQEGNRFNIPNGQMLQKIIKIVERPTDAEDAQDEERQSLDPAPAPGGS